MTLLVFGLPASAEDVRADDWKTRGATFEKRTAWAEACRCYEDVLRKERGNVIAREGYRRSLRRLHLATRQADATYRQSLTKLTPPQALEIYEQVLSILRVAYPDRARINLQLLFQNGLQEMQFALDDPLFRRHQLPGVKPELIEAYKKRLDTWSAHITTLSGAREEALLVIRSAAEEKIKLTPSLVSALTLEFAAGACNTLDEFSSFLTPGSMSTVQAALKGKLLGVGVELGVVADRLTVTRVYPKSPAAQAGFLKGDLVLEIAGVNVQNLPADVAAERLRGDRGSAVEITIGRADAKKSFRLSRRSFPVSSVEYHQLPLDSVMNGGYLRIHHFQDSTFQEVKDALAAMNTGDPIKGLILDLRGNPGGVFKSAVAIAELFLGEGIIVVGQSTFKDFNRTYKADNPTASQIPAVVLVDGETASAAEVLAGALKESRAAFSTMLLGQTTFGKGSIQVIIPMDKSPLEKLAGIRLTVARFLSPSNSPVTGRGIVPTISSDAEGAALLDEAQGELLKLINAVMRPPRMMGGAS